MPKKTDDDSNALTIRALDQITLKCVALKGNCKPLPTKMCMSTLSMVSENSLLWLWSQEVLEGSLAEFLNPFCAHSLTLQFYFQGCFFIYDVQFESSCCCELMEYTYIDLKRENEIFPANVPFNIWLRIVITSWYLIIKQSLQSALQNRN